MSRFACNTMNVADQQVVTAADIYSSASPIYQRIDSPILNRKNRNRSDLHLPVHTAVVWLAGHARAAECTLLLHY